MLSAHPVVSDSARRLRNRQLLPPTVVTALLWIGVQVLVMLYVRTAVGFLGARDADVALQFQQAVARGSGAGLPLVTWAWITNGAFALLLSIQLLVRPRSPGLPRNLAFLVYGGTAILLLLTSAAWNTTLGLARTA